MLRVRGPLQAQLLAYFLTEKVQLYMTTYTYAPGSDIEKNKTDFVNLYPV